MTLVMAARKIMLVLDVSSSMAEPGGEKSTKLDDAKKGALNDIDHRNLNSNDELGLITFSNSAEIICPLAPATKEYVDNIVKPAITSLTVTDKTALWDAIGIGLDVLHGRKDGSDLTLVVLTDGEDNASTKFHSCREIFNYAEQKGIKDVMIFILGIGLIDDIAKCLDEFAAASGGKYYPTQADKIPEAFGKMGNHFRGQGQTAPQGSYQRTSPPVGPNKEIPKELYPFSHDDAVRAYADRLKGKGHKVRTNVSISKRSGKMHVDLHDKTENTYIEIVLGIPDEKGLQDLLRKLIRLNNIVNGRLKVVFVTAHKSALPGWFRTVCEELGIEIEFMDPVEAALGTLDFSFNKDGTIRNVGFKAPMNVAPFNLIPSDEGGPCLPVLVVVPEVVGNRVENLSTTAPYPCYKYFPPTDTMPNKNSVPIGNDPTDHICGNLMEACNHAFECNQKGQNRKVIVIWSKKMESTGLTNNNIIMDCWHSFEMAMEELKKRYGTVFEVQIK